MMDQPAGNPNNNLKAVSIGVLAFSQTLYFVLSGLSLLFFTAAVLGLGLVEDYSHVFWDEPIAAGIWVRAWALTICQIAFPFVAIIVSCLAWYFYRRGLYRRAISITLSPLLLLVFFSLIAWWNPYVLHW
jgi:hypothetical protein